MANRTKCVAAAILAVAAGVLAAPTSAAPSQPARVVTVAPAPRTAPGPAPRDLLADRLGSAAATAPASVPEGEVTRAAEKLALVDAAVRSYGPVRVAVYRLADESVAAVLLAALEPANAARADVGDDAWAVAEDGLGLRAGAYVALVQGGTPEARAAAASDLVARAGRQPIRAPFARVLPPENRVAGSERYVATYDALKAYRPDLDRDLFRLGAGGADAVLADYAQPSGSPLRLLVVQYQTPQLAADAERSLAAYYEGLPADAKATRSVRREGNYLVEATGVTDPSAASAASGGVKYDVSIKMLEGLDPVSSRDITAEAQKAAAVFINSFAIVGICFLAAIAVGLVVGGVIFARRRAAAAEKFSDAGGMVNLDLGHGARALRRGGPEPVGLLPGGHGD